MTDLRIGVVAEGPTDQIVMRHLLTAYCKVVRPDIKPIFKDLHPVTDRTSSGSSEGGWTMVYQWCLNNPPLARQSQFAGAGLFDGDMDGLTCDIILVHMDADICERIRDKSDVKPVPDATAPPAERGDFIRKTILGWLWPTGSEPDDRHIPAPAVEAVEAWLVAAMADDPEPEAVTDILLRLLEVDCLSRGRPFPKDGKAIRKSRVRYEDIARRCAGNVARVAERCPHFLSLANVLFPAHASPSDRASI